MSKKWLAHIGLNIERVSPLRVKLVYRLGFTLVVALLAMASGWVGNSLIPPVSAQDVTYFRIATGEPGSQSFDIAGDITKAISNPVATDECDAGDNCGVPGVIGMAQTTSGALESLRLLGVGQVDGAIVQADMAALAVTGKGPFKSIGPNPNIRAIATVGDITLQVIVPQKSTFQTFTDLKGRRVAISVIETDTSVSINQVLSQLGVVDKKTKLVALSLADAKQQLIAGTIDAIAIMDRPNTPDLMEINDHMSVRLLSVSSAEFSKLGGDRHDILLTHLPVGTDGSSASADTLLVPMLFVVSAKASDVIAFDLAKTLIVPKRGTRTTANPAASSPDAHIESTVIPLHPGVERLLQTTN